MSRNRSGPSLVHSAIEFKSWQQQLSTAEVVRPTHCPACGAASHPVGGRLRVHGHGVRERQVRGPTGFHETAALVVLKVRRYRCLPCGAVIVVAPRELLPRRQYSAAAIGLALTLYGLALASAREVRRRVSPHAVVGATAATGWATLRRWARAVARRRLFPRIPLPDPGATLRRVAASAAASLAAYADPTSRGEALWNRAFLGAAHAA